MSINLFVDKEIIPSDGSLELLYSLEKEIPEESASIYVYPDVHYKKGASVTNGLVIKSKNKIIPACLGIENCGFTFGLIDKNQNLDNMIYAAKILSRNHFCKKKYIKEFIIEKFDEYLRIDFEKKREMYLAIGFKDVEKLIKTSVSFLKKNNLDTLAAKSLCTLGTGNHFFELHKIISSDNNDLKDNYIIIVHSDSIQVGEYINNYFSNLSETEFFPFLLRTKLKIKYRMLQFHFFIKNGILVKDLKNFLKLCYSRNEGRVIDKDSIIGQNLLFAHNLASIFGEINRRELINRFEEICGIKVNILGSHSHDSISIEKYNEQDYIIHRNGVQNIGKDKYFILPQAMGVGLIVMQNPMNEVAFFSANHGTGRLQDKHIAKEAYDEKQTEDEMKEHDVVLYRSGKGNIAEQNHNAFKDINIIAEQMKKYNLGVPVARTKPVFVIKDS
ncbi:RtcB family protein [Enterocloster bolteae]|uniref:RtcB family protein n=1 Tax=Enterocloster bolteae TaxID=208479 RepID=UPI00210B3331|nr:RtcB family protein [Enterocloster bolteae]